MEKKKVVYLVLLKSLADEKYLDFMENYEEFGIKVAVRLPRIPESLIADSNTYLSFNPTDVMVCHRRHASGCLSTGSEKWAFRREEDGVDRERRHER